MHVTKFVRGVRARHLSACVYTALFTPAHEVRPVRRASMILRQQRAAHDAHRSLVVTSALDGIRPVRPAQLAPTDGVGSRHVSVSVRKTCSAAARQMRPSSGACRLRSFVCSTSAPNDETRVGWRPGPSMVGRLPQWLHSPEYVGTGCNGAVSTIACIVPYQADVKGCGSFTECDSRHLQRGVGFVSAQASQQPGMQGTDASLAQSRPSCSNLVKCMGGLPSASPGCVASRQVQTVSEGHQLVLEQQGRPSRAPQRSRTAVVFVGWLYNLTPRSAAGAGHAA